LYFVGLGLRPTTGGAYQQTGPTLSATPGAPVYVDAASAAGGGADGLTPATAYPTLFPGVLRATALLLAAPTASVNVWVKGGSYTIASALPIAAGVNVYGGFGAAFDLASRDLANAPSVWNVNASQTAFQYGDQFNTSLAVVVDGVRITGNGVGAIGADTDGTDPCQLELRSVIVTDMADRGLRLRNLTDSGFDVVLTSCQSSRNGADGLSGVGAFDYSVYNCVFASNVQEGFDLSDLTAETGGVARMRVTSSQFFGNGAQGLDCTMGVPLFPNSASFEIEVRGCAFEGNAQAGCLIDADFELVPAYSADVVVRESFARANIGHGFQFDLDGPLDPNGRLTAFAVGLLATGNGLDGIYISSESREGLTVLSTSAMIGNLGAGLRIEGPAAALGNRSIEATHCLFASNFGGGMISRDVSSSASSSIAYLQPNAFDANTLQTANVSSNSPAALAFVNAPEEYARVSARSGAVLTLTAAPSFSTGAKLELADDGIERTIASIVNTQVTLSAAPAAFGTPGLLAAFAPGAVGVNENYDLAGGSIAIAAGLGGADAGPAGSPVVGRVGVASPEQALVFHPLGSTPEIAALVGNNESVVIEFSKTLNGASANAGTVRARRGANAISITIQTLGAELTLIPPGGGWGAGDFRVELGGLTAGDGTALSGSVVLPFNR
ncbi:MAG: right-handed parallel beta-helix repeat-containing protein, partial [Planctomycetes bacterium]|nr:right-handed parallel beta-helix repeat-containing protein [Planctomycetota bacterium]